MVSFVDKITARGRGMLNKSDMMVPAKTTNINIFKQFFLTEMFDII